MDNSIIDQIDNDEIDITNYVIDDEINITNDIIDDDQTDNVDDITNDVIDDDEVSEYDSNNSDEYNEDIDYNNQESIVKCLACNKQKYFSEMAFSEIIQIYDTIKKYDTYCIECDKTVMKKCAEAPNGCGKMKPLRDFDKANDKFGRSPYCKECRMKLRRSTKNKRPPKGTIVYCPKCKQNYDESKFHADSYAKNGLQTNCALCKQKSNATKSSTLYGFLKNIWKDIRSNAHKRNINVDITLQDIIDCYKKQNGLCMLTGIKMTYKYDIRTENSSWNKNPYNISVDRIDSNKGYELNNIHCVCSSVNRFKMANSVDRYINIMMKIGMNKASTCPIDMRNDLVKALIDYNNNEITDIINKYDSETDSNIITKTILKMGKKRKTIEKIEV